MSKNKLILKNALIITFLIGIFFLLSKAVGLADNPALRIFNIFFVFIGVYFAIRENMHTYQDRKYITNFGVGLQTSILSVILSIVGVLVYSKIINPAFFEVIQNSVLIGKNLNLFEIIFTFAIEGMAISVIASFMMMQYFKKDILKEVKEKINPIES
jgi:drug/metabolite transporter (DMT)-like permease